MRVQNTKYGAWLVYLVRAKDSEIMKLLEEQAGNLVKATSVLVEIFGNYSSHYRSRDVAHVIEALKYR